MDKNLPELSMENVGAQSSAEWTSMHASGTSQVSTNVSGICSAVTFSQRKPGGLFHVHLCGGKIAFSIEPHTLTHMTASGHVLSSPIIPVEPCLPHYSQ